MAEEEPGALADALNAINRANLSGLATADQWTDLVNEYPKSGGLSVDQRMCIPSDSRRTLGLTPLPQPADQLFHWSTH